MFSLRLFIRRVIWRWSSSRRDRWIAVVLGTTAMLIGGVYLVSGGSDTLAEFLGLFAGFGAITALVYGVCSSRASGFFTRFVSGFGWFLLWMVLLAVPFGVRWGILRFEASRVPLPTTYNLSSIQVDPVKYNTRPDYVVSVLIDQPVNMTRQFYRTEYKRRGWTFHLPERRPLDLAREPPDWLRDMAAHAMQVHEPEEPLEEGIVEGLMIFRRDDDVLAIQVFSGSKPGERATTYARIHPFEIRWPFSENASW